jgi:uncharacterized Ntn-hydrolase superfamily protein
MDLRVNDHPLPLVELRRLLTVFRSATLIREANETFDSGDTAAGLAKMLEISGFLPDRANVWTDLASMYLRSNRRADALKAIAQAVELNPTGRAQVAEDARFQTLRADPEFMRIVRP